MQSGPAATLLSLCVLAAFALAAGGLWMAVRRKDLKRALLMLAAAVVILGNVLIWAWPAA